MRSHLDRSAPRAPTAPATGFDADVPKAGFYRFRLIRGGVWVGVRVWFGAPIDPVTGEEMDRGHRWQAMVNDSPIALERVWPACADEPIDELDYRHLCAVQAWAEQHAPETGYADPSRKLDLLSSATPIPF